MPSSVLSMPFHKLVKLDFPKFCGGDPTSWLFKVTQFFTFHQTPENQKLQMASFHMEGPASSWFQWMSNSNQVRSWPKFEAALKNRFGPSAYADPQGALSKLTQSGSVLDYQTEFEELSTKVYGMSDHFLKSCFVSGLKPEIKREVIAHQPYGLHQAIGLARLQEDKIAECCLMNRQWNSKFGTQPSILGPSPIFSAKKTSQNFPTNVSTFKPSTSNSNPTNQRIPIKRLSFPEMQQKREKGLCFNCEEQFHLGHKCKNQVSILLLEEGDDIFYSEEPDLSETKHLDMMDKPTNMMDKPTISFHALMGLTVSRTLRLEGFIINHKIQVLVDGGSTHNFIQERVAKFLGLPITQSPHFKVHVGNGEFMMCQGLCSNIRIELQNHSFVTDLFVISLQGADVILGVQWLQTLGPVTTDYTSLAMNFMWQGKTIQLHGIQEHQSDFISPTQLHKWLMMGVRVFHAAVYINS
ncbi:uncharacterized protein LOC143857236 [Tasmannia lanceolata]|uniref:uncharacterized protein LOC143857236 n=1 Tax=Tasmannia lanceolata TaxID=3420 RepID=UPI004064B190